MVTSWHIVLQKNLSLMRGNVCSVSDGPALHGVVIALGPYKLLEEPTGDTWTPELHKFEKNSFSELQMIKLAEILPDICFFFFSSLGQFWLIPSLHPLHYLIISKMSLLGFFHFRWRHLFSISITLEYSSTSCWAGLLSLFCMATLHSMWSFSPLIMSSSYSQTIVCKIVSYLPDSELLSTSSGTCKWWFRASAAIFNLPV